MNTAAKRQEDPQRESVSGAQDVDTDAFYIQTTTAPADEVRRVLKHGETFAVFDRFGDIRAGAGGEDGLYHEGTRFLSCLALRLGNERPLFLSSTIRDENDLLTVDLTNVDALVGSHIAIPRGTLHISRTKFLREGVAHERIRFRNYGLAPVEATFTLHFQADFADIFEVRGSRRPRRGTLLPAKVESGAVTLGYRGLDGVLRYTRLAFSPPQVKLAPSAAQLHLTLAPRGETVVTLSISCSVGGSWPGATGYDQALAEAAHEMHQAQAHRCVVDTSHEAFNGWLRRTVADLHMMVTQTPQGPYPYAGVPWFSTAFGRDGLITALQCLWCDPTLARGVLAFLAHTQATATIPEQDAEPGKILHETRRGEMAALGEIPFGRYYGSVDSTPLFVMLAGAYHERTADLDFIRSLWPNIKAALDWIDGPGDPDGDGLVEYERRTSRGLVQQGWKDSHDSVFHADGSLARGPIALCEVQGYVYAARLEAARLAELLGEETLARRQRDRAARLQQRFEDLFWCEDLSTYALALDGEKRACRVRSSNPGHCLLTGLPSIERARRVARSLLAEDSFSGWGVRTLSEREVRYNPMSYHNGSVWPHDNALIAQGLARYGLETYSLPILSGLFEASRYVDLHRLPELFCGFARRPGEAPTLYPVACAPQAWAAATPLYLLHACLGLRISGPEQRVAFYHPCLPDYLGEVWIRNLRVGQATVDLLLVNHGHDVGIQVLRREGNLEILTVK